MAHGQRFLRSERLSQQRFIQLLFSKGGTLRFPPLRIRYLAQTPSINAPLHQVLFIVPKRNLKLAVHRNKIKRRLREAYRKTKYLLEDVTDLSYLISYQFEGSGNLNNYPFAMLQKIVHDSLLTVKAKLQHKI